MFNGPDALLLETEPAERIAISGDTFRLDFWIAHYGSAQMDSSPPHWVLRSGGTTLAQGLCDGGKAELGSTRLLASTELSVPKASKAAHAVLEASVDQDAYGRALRNKWDFWIFPKRGLRNGSGIAVSEDIKPMLDLLYTGLASVSTPAGQDAELLVVSELTEEVEKALACGKRVLLVQGYDTDPNVGLGWLNMGEQVGPEFADHPALGDFPHGGFLSQLAFRIVKKGRPPPFAGMMPDDMFVVGEGGAGHFLYAGQANIGGGRVLMTFGLDIVSCTPEGTCLLDGLIDYARSAAFEPKSEVGEII